jgi:uncharacterized membrane protein
MPNSHSQQEPHVAVQHSVLIEAPIAVVYERWNRVEDYPSFMEGVREIAWLDERRFSLKSEHEGQYFLSICEVALRIPERRMAWRTLEGPDSSGVACFQNAGSGRTEVTLKMRYNPNDGWQNIELVEQRLRGNLERFKSLVETAQSVPQT